jgi:hypothetical protein
MRERKEFDRALVHVELLEVEHAASSPDPIRGGVSFTASITPTASFPFTSAATITASITSTATITARTVSSTHL